MTVRALFLVFLILVPHRGFAHPVSFKNGYGIMPGYSPERQELELNYSFTHRSAAAVNFINLEYEDEDLRFILPQFNYKLYRGNELESQTNLYISLGAGGARYEGDTELAGIVAVQADYETRRFYTLLMGEHLQTEGIGLNRIRYRIGAAPYLASFEGFHTWVIAQIEYTPELEEEITITPMLRFFYQNYLIEVGSSIEGDIFVAGIFHF